MRTWFWTCARPEMMRPVWPPEMPKTYSMPASAKTRATSTRDGVSSFSIRSMAIALLPSSPIGFGGKLATAEPRRHVRICRLTDSTKIAVRLFLERTNTELKHARQSPQGPARSRTAIPGAGVHRRADERVRPPTRRHARLARRGMQQSRLGIGAGRAGRHRQRCGRLLFLRRGTRAGLRQPLLLRLPTRRGQPPCRRRLLAAQRSAATSSSSRAQDALGALSYNGALIGNPFRSSHSRRRLTVDLTNWAGLAATCFVASLLQATNGFGFAVLAVPFFLLLSPPAETVPTIVIISLAVSLFVMPGLYRSADRDLLRRLTVGSLLALPLGIVAFDHANPTIVGAIAGAIVT